MVSASILMDVPVAMAVTINATFNHLFVIKQISFCVHEYSRLEN